MCIQLLVSYYVYNCEINHKRQQLPNNRICYNKRKTLTYHIKFNCFVIVDQRLWFWQQLGNTAVACEHFIGKYEDYSGD